MEYATENLGDVFGGVFLTNEASHIDVYVTGRTDGVASKLASALGLPLGELSVLTTPTTEAQQNALNAFVSQEYVTLRDTGIDLVAWRPDVRTGHEQIELVDATDSERQALAKEFGPNVDVVSIRPEERPELLDRQNDTAPWNGGDFIHSTGNGYATDCTSGIPMHNPGGGQYMLTAAHCFLTTGHPNAGGGLTVDLGSYGLQWGNLNTAIGNVTNVGVSLTNPGTWSGIDTTLISTTGSDVLYTGATQNASRSVISGSLGSPGGAQVCTDGAFEGQYCSEIVATNSTVTFQNCDEYGDTCVFSNIIGATGTNTQDVGEGDSGGPMVRYSGSAMYVVGTITGGYGTQVTCGNYSQWNPPDPRHCWNNVYYTAVQAPMAQWGISPNVG